MFQTEKRNEINNSVGEKVARDFLHSEQTHTHTGQVVKRRCDKGKAAAARSRSGGGVFVLTHSKHSEKGKNTSQ